MKKTRKIGLAIAACLTLAIDVSAQVDLSGEVRPRTEYRHGFKNLPDSAARSALFTDQRTRLNFGYKAEGYAVKIVLQDIRVWGNTTQLNTTDGFTSVHEAWGEAYLTDKISFRFGRQEISYDDHRIFGNVGWAQQARSHDAGIFKIKLDSTFRIDIGGAYNQSGTSLNTTYYALNNYKSFQYLWAHKDFSKNFDVSILFLNNGIQAEQTDSFGVLRWKDNYSQTAGTRLTYKKSGFSVAGAFYYQMGVSGDWANTEIAAMNARIDLGYKINDNISANAGYELLSGNSQTDTTASYNEVNHAFAPFYGTNHKFNGFMDYFYVGNHAGSVGLQDIFVGLKFKKDKLFAKVDLHLFSAAEDVLDIDKLVETGEYTAMNSSLGTEIDFSFGGPIAKGVMLKGGYSHMIGTETMVALRGGDLDEISNWAYVMLIIKPNFLKK